MESFMANSSKWEPSNDPTFQRGRTGPGHRAELGARGEGVDSVPPGGDAEVLVLKSEKKETGTESNEAIISREAPDCLA